MTRKYYENVTVPVIVQQVGGDLRLRGRNGSDLVIDGDTVKVEQIGNGQPYLVRCAGDCRLYVPTTVKVIVQQVGGDAKITDLGDDAEIGEVGGDLTLRSVKRAQIQSVGGDLKVTWAEGDVIIQNVGADATIRQISGSVRIENVGSKLYLRNIEGSCVVENVGSDLVLNIEFQPDREYRFAVEGDILCRVHPETSARFVLPLDMEVSADVEANITLNEEGAQQTVTLGEGGALVQIEDGGELRLVSEEEDYALDLGAQIEEQVEAHLSTLEEKLSQQLAGLDEKIQAKTEKWASQAERIAERAQRQAERATERFRRSMERQKDKRKRGMSGAAIGFGWEPRPAVPPTPPRPRSEPVREEERLMILRMVQDKKITIEEAERLLAALDQRE